MSRDEETYGRIRKQYDAWVDAEAARPARARLRRVDNYIPTSERPEMSKNVFAAIGIGIGVVLLGLSAYAFSTASYWAGFARDGAAVGYTLVGVFLLIAGAGGIIATWNHNFRVLTRSGGHGGH